MGKPYGAIGSILGNILGTLWELVGNKQKIHSPPPPPCHKEKNEWLMSACWAFPFATWNSSFENSSSWFFTWANIPFQERGHLSLFNPLGTPYLFITKLETMTHDFFKEFLPTPKWLSSIWSCRTSGNCPYKYFARSEYKPDMKFKILIIFIYVWLHTEN
jgi:hypothetical protein